jgi:very-short-patch-repair endonuclease
MTIERARTLRKNMPPAEAKMWNALRELKPLGFHFRRQVPLGNYYADFACHHANLVVEIDGESHFVGSGPTSDGVRSAFIRSEGYEVLRFTNVDVLNNIDGVIARLLIALEGKALQPSQRVATPTLNPSPQGGGTRRSRAIVEVGHRSLSQLPPPRGEGSTVGVPVAPTSEKIP